MKRDFLKKTYKNEKLLKQKKRFSFRLFMLFMLIFMITIFFIHSFISSNFISLILCWFLNFWISNYVEKLKWGEKWENGGLFKVRFIFVGVAPSRVNWKILSVSFGPIQLSKIHRSPFERRQNNKKFFFQ
jgi:hypothetical protein